MPIYDGGLSYATTRQAKEQLGQTGAADRSAARQGARRGGRRLGREPELVGVLRAARAEVQAAEVALAGVREEAKVGQRTTLDVLNAQQALLNARVQLVTAQHDRSSIPTACCRRSGGCRSGPWASPSPNTIRASISTR